MHRPRMLAPGSPAAVDQAVLRTIAYGDVFDYPLRALEVHRYLHRIHTTIEVTSEALARCATPAGPLARCDDHYMLRGREHLVQLRRERAAHAARLWPTAVRYGRLIAGLPFVRLVAVTGSLAWDNVAADADIDYLLVTEPDHLWTCRLLVAALARAARLDGIVLCANYMVSKRALPLAERTLYGAYELATLTPIVGRGVYHRLLRANPWAAAYLPHAFGTPAVPAVPAAGSRAPRRPWTGRLARVGERLLRSRVGMALERCEMRHRIKKRLNTGLTQPEASYGLDWYKAHCGGNRQRALLAFDERLAGLEESRWTSG